jgi:hypothetical protein
VKCPRCGTYESRVKKTIIQVEERGFAFGELKQRRRECLSCRSPFHSVEIHESLLRWLLAGYDGPLPKIEESDQTGSPSRPIRSPNASGSKPGRPPLEFRRSLDDE